jgi:hypothetical protein
MTIVNAVEHEKMLSDVYRVMSPIATYLGCKE